jgi:hypothetical protein
MNYYKEEIMNSKLFKKLNEEIALNEIKAKASKEDKQKLEENLIFKNLIKNINTNINSSKR